VGLIGRRLAVSLYRHGEFRNTIMISGFANAATHLEQ
jgi:hypothetical protein